MDDLSRRRMLITGGALGALGALGAASPARAKSLWTWAPSGSVAGKGAGVDPDWVWDEEADPVLAAVIERGEVAKVNAALRTWTRNDQPLLDGLPADLRDFMERARQLPPWTDRAKLADAARFTTKKGIYTGALYGLGSGLMSTAIPREARAVYYSKGGADMKDRIAKTAQLGYDVGDLDAYQPSGGMVVTAVKTRLVHAAVRHLLPQSPGWSRTSGGQTIPISQADIMVTWHSLATFVMSKLIDWGSGHPSPSRPATCTCGRSPPTCSVSWTSTSPPPGTRPTPSPGRSSTPSWPRHPRASNSPTCSSTSSRSWTPGSPGP